MHQNSAAGTSVTAQPSSSRGRSTASAALLAAASPTSQPDNNDSGTLGRSSSSNWYSASSSNGRSVLRRTVSDDAGVMPRRQVQKSVSFADLPTWHTSAPDTAAGTYQHHTQSWAAHSSIHAQTAGHKQSSRASDSAMSSSTHGDGSSGNSGDAEHQEPMVDFAPRKESVVAALSTSDRSRASSNAGLQTWRESVATAKQHGNAAESAHAGALPSNLQQEDYSSRLSSLAAAAAAVEHDLRAVPRLQQEHQQQEQQQQQTPHRTGGSSSSSDHVPTGWTPQLTLVREESPSPSPEKIKQPDSSRPAAAAATASRQATYSSTFSGAPVSAAAEPLLATEECEVVELRAALAAARAELAASHELLEELAAEVPDASKLFEAGAKQEQALQEVGT